MESLCWPPSDDVGSGHLVHRYYNRIRGEWSHSIVRCGVYRLTSYREISSCHFLYIDRDTLSYRPSGSGMSKVKTILTWKQARLECLAVILPVSYSKLTVAVALIRLLRRGLHCYTHGTSFLKYFNKFWFNSFTAVNISAMKLSYSFVQGYRQWWECK